MLASPETSVKRLLFFVYLRRLLSLLNRTTDRHIRAGKIWSYPNATRGYAYNGTIVKRNIISSLKFRNRLISLSKDPCIGVRESLFWLTSLITGVKLFRRADRL